MTWRSDTLDVLASSAPALRYVVRSTDNTPAGTSVSVSLLLLSSHDEGPYYQRVIARTGHRISGGELRPVDWTCSIGEATIMLTGGYDPRGSVVRGMLVSVLVGWRGLSVNEFENVFTGRIAGVFRTATGEWGLVIRSILSSLYSRSTLVDGQTNLFYDNVGTEGLTTVDYTAGAGTLTVASTTNAERETGGKYLVELTPDSGEPFLITCTSKTATDFTIFNAGILNTTDANAAAGATWRPLAYVNDHPVNVARKVMLSGGTLGSVYDTLPDSWGCALNDDNVDNEDIDLTISQNPTTSALLWAVWSDAPQADGLSWFSSFLAPAGYFVTERQGKITIRMGVEPADGCLDTQVVGPRDIVSIDRYDLWDPMQAVEYGSFRGIAGATSVENGGGAITSLPSVQRYDALLPFINTSQSTWINAINGRIGVWRTRIGEVIELTCLGWRLAGLAPGSSLLLTLPGGLVPHTEYVDSYWFVVLVEPDWFGATTRIKAIKLSENSDQP